MRYALVEAILSLNKITPAGISPFKHNEPDDNSVCMQPLLPVSSGSHSALGHSDEQPVPSFGPVPGLMKAC